jgi:hypothetical protein
MVKQNIFKVSLLMLADTVNAGGLTSGLQAFEDPHLSVGVPHPLSSAEHRGV